MDPYARDVAPGLSPTLDIYSAARKEIMTTMTTPNLPDSQRDVLMYYAREVLAIDNSAAPLAGLPLDRFRTARIALLNRGLLTESSNGRYRPTAMAADNYGVPT